MMDCTNHPISSVLAKQGVFVTAFGILSAILLPILGVVDGYASETQLTVYADATVFNDPAYDPKVRVDFPFSLNRADYEFFRPDSTDPSLFARVFAQVTLYGVDGMPSDSSNTYFSVKAASLEEAAKTDYTLFNRLSLFVVPGIYSGRLTVIDVVSKSQGEYFFDKIIVEPPSPEDVTLGGGNLAFRITRTEDGDPSDRIVLNGYRIFCSPLGIFTDQDSLAYLYAELYNLEYEAEKPSDYKLAYTALDAAGAVYRDFGYKLRTKPGNSVVVVEQFQIGDWPVGQYTLRLIATDLATAGVDTMLLPLRIMIRIQPGTVLVQTGFTNSYDTLSLSVKEHLVAYLLSPDQKQTLSRLTPEGKDVFLNEFWRENDIDQNTKVIENLLEMVERYNFCNRFFSYNIEKTNGWSTDRGRIYMSYGPWDQKDDVSAPDLGNPIIIWFYHSLEEGAVFVFEDRQGFHDYTLVHSNVKGERFSKEWEELLRGEQYKSN